MNIPAFVKEHVIERDQSLFAPDILARHDELEHEIKGKSVLVVGGAGSIGSSFIKEVLKFRPSELVVVDLTEKAASTAASTSWPISRPTSMCAAKRTASPFAPCWKTT